MDLRVYDLISQEEILNQIAEECSRVATDALYLARTMDDDNPLRDYRISAKARLTQSIGRMRCAMEQLYILNEDDIHKLQMKRLAEWITTLLDQRDLIESNHSKIYAYRKKHKGEKHHGN